MAVHMAIGGFLPFRLVYVPRYQLHRVNCTMITTACIVLCPNAEQEVRWGR